MKQERTSDRSGIDFRIIKRGEKIENKKREIWMKGMYERTVR